VDLGAFSVTALRFFSTVTTLSLLPPFVVASTVRVDNLNVEFLSGHPFGDFVTSVTGTAPIVSSGGQTPAISITAADATHAGSVPLSGTPATNQYLRATITTGALSWQQIAYTDISGTPSIPTQYWSRAGTVLSPATAGDSISITGAVTASNYTTGTGTDLILTLTDAAGVRKLLVKDSGSATVASINSDGRVDATLLVSSGEIYGTNGNLQALYLTSATPSIYQKVVRTGQSGFAFDMYDLQAQNSNGTAVLGKIGAYGSVVETGSAVPLLYYLYIDGSTTAAYDNAFVKIDRANRMALGLTSNTRPTTAMLEVYGTIYTTGDMKAATFHVGADAGIDATVPVAPVLPATTAGSMTFKKGILTAYTPPS
jgi:hypothetical protein